MEMGCSREEFETREMSNDLLVVVDMQNDFVDGALGSEAAQDIVSKAAAFIRDFKGRVVYTKDSHGEDYLETQEGKNLPVEHCITRTEGWEFAPEIAEVVKDSDRVLYKRGFGSTDLAGLVRGGQYDNIYFCGLCTGICVLANVVLAKTYSPESRIHVLSDLCACVTRDTHLIALDAMKLLQVDIMESRGYHV